MVKKMDKKGCEISGCCCKAQCIKKIVTVFILGVAIVFVGNMLSFKVMRKHKCGCHKMRKLDGQTCQRKLKWCSETGKECPHLKEKCSRIGK